MKKIFSLLLMLFVGVGMWAADETVVFSEQGYSNQEAVESYSGTDFTVTFNKGTNSNAPKYYTSGNAVRVYGGSYFTVASSTKTISKIELGFGSGDGSNAITTDVETYSNGTWTGSASSVTFTIGGTSGHRRIASIAVTFDNGAVYVATPEISGATPFATSTQVTITCATEGASIYYTLDGATPTANSTAYSGPFSLTATTTVKAIAYDANNNASGVVSKEFVKIPSVATVAEFNALAQGSNFMFTGEGLVATVQKGNYLYAQDETGGMLIYGTISPEYTMGDVIPAGFTATKAEYSGAAQAGTPQNMEDAVDSQTVTAKEFEAADFAAATFAELSNFGIYGVVRGVTVNVNDNTLTLADGTTVVNTYNTFANAPTTAAGDIYDVYGIMGWHNGVQLLPIDYQLQAATAHAAPVITVKPEKDTYFVGEEVTVILSSEETGVNIGYDITDAETFPENYYVPVSNGDSITVTADAPKTVTVRAFAYGYEEGDALENSEVVTKEIVFIALPTLGDSYELVTSADQIAAGKEYVLAYSNETVTKAMGGAALYGTNNVRVAVDAGATEFTLADNVLTLMSTTTVAPFTLETSENEGYYNIKIDGDKYLSWTTGNTVMTGTEKGEVTVELNEAGNAVIKYNEDNENEDRYLQYNTGSPRFCFYTGTQKYPQLYVKVEPATAHAAPVITLNPEKEVYFVGDEVSVIFSSEETGVNIGYDITDAETFPENYYVPVSNGDSITITADAPKTVTVRAFAYGYEEGDALENSEVVTKEIVFHEIPVPGDKYELVTDSTQIVADNEYVLVYVNGDVAKAMGGKSLTGGTPYRTAVDAGVTEFTLENGVVTLMSTTTVTPFVLETAKENRFYIKIDGKDHIYWSAGNSMESGSVSDEMLLTLDADGNVEIKDYSAWGDERFLQCNPTSQRYAFYKASSNQKNAKLYVKVAATPVKLGDVNGDGDVNVNDVTVLINYILGKNPTPFVEANANVNGDEGINVNDVTALINMILN